MHHSRQSWGMLLVLLAHQGEGVLPSAHRAWTLGTSPLGMLLWSRGGTALPCLNPQPKQGRWVPWMSLG